MKPDPTTLTVADIIRRLEAEIAEKQKAIAMLKAIVANATKGSQGRPRIYSVSDDHQVAALIADGYTQREVASVLGLPHSTVENIAKRTGAVRTQGDWRGGPRTAGVVTPGRKHRRLRP